MALTGQSKHAVTLNRFPKAGQAWLYDQSDITYDGEFDANGRKVFYDGVGTATTLTGLSPKHAVSLSTSIKHTA